MKYIDKVFDRMFYWEVGKERITITGEKIGSEYEIKIVKVEGRGIPYEMYSRVVEKGREDIERILRKNPRIEYIESILETNFNLFDPFGLLRLGHKIGIIKPDNY